MSDIAQPGLVDVEGVGALGQRLGRYIRWIIAFSLVGLLVGILVLVFVPAKYEAVAVVAPPIDRSGAKVRGDVSTSSPTGLLAGLAGAQSAPPVLQRFEQTLHSRRLADELIKDGSLAHKIFAGQWDAQSQTWVKPTGLLASVHEFILRLLHRPTDTTPTAWHLEDFLGRYIVVTPLPRSSAFQIKYSCPERDFCLELLRTVVENADGLIRQDVIEHDRSYSSFIAARMQSVTDVVDRQVLTNLLSDIRRDEMLADSGVNYSMDLVDGPSVSSLPTEPRIGLTLALGLFGGLMLSTIGVLVYESLGLEALISHLRR
ncbi:hypothetical protein GCM10011611_36930 [Aliidongia dinghuensis]|uniref:Polysaccharide chain length determinant N-terminal domain-containing protein n=1 Tax=Aliidongia dinghuensis TaxID=1867774 RepID=A0A8J2YVK7_9PROT|nr:Wzz/FepE/Etk N-terminal domain-containing protein [Aliidongia dinghuensis]GGF27521.1 hypothetical protein GCM10011611_36930 [Aliidongia dinghuensis]